MGFDDSVRDSNILEKTLDELTGSYGLISTYVFDHFKPSMTQEALEHCEEDILGDKYHGYSLAYRMILPLINVSVIGITFEGPPNWLFAKLRTREIVLTHLFESFDWDANANADEQQRDLFIASVREQIATATSLQEDACRVYNEELNARVLRHVQSESSKTSSEQKCSGSRQDEMRKAGKDIVVND